MQNLSIGISPFMVIFLINLCLAFILVFMQRRDPSATWAWLMVLLFIPILGFLLYLFLGQDLKRKKTFHVKVKSDETKTIAHREKRQIQYFLSETKNPVVSQYSSLAHLHFMTGGFPLTEDNEVEILQNGAEKFPALLSSLQEARRYIHMEYYILRNDELGRRIIEVLSEKAREGVEVKLLYDGMGCIRVPRKFFKPLLKAGGQIANFYPPFLPYINLRVNYRNHRKICVVDGKTAFIGGLNIGDEYLGKSKKFGFWRDIHLKIQGSALYYLQFRFLLDWEFCTGEKNVFKDTYFPKIDIEGKAGVQIVSSGPDSKWASVKQGYFKMIMGAKKKIYIQTPYFVPDDSIIEALKVAALSGIDVRVMVPCKPDHPFVYWATMSYVGELLEAGVKCYTYLKGFLHSKLVIIDGCVGSVGTANMDIRSFKMNFEVNAFIYDEEVVKSLEKGFLLDLKDSKEVTITEYARRSPILKFKESISRLLSPLL